MSLNDGFSSDDDDLLEELKEKPPRSAQVSRQTQLNQPPNATKNDKSENEVETLKNILTAAQGEASMLRDKIEFLNKERDQDKDVESKQKERLEELHLNQIQKLQNEIQSLKDENKFLLIESKRLTSRSTHQPRYSDHRTDSSSLSPSPHTNSNNITGVNESTANTTVPTDSPILKKRKIEEYSLLAPKAPLLQLNSTRIVPDELGSFVDSILSFRLPGVKLTIIEFLNTIKLAHVKDYQYETFHKSPKESIGKSLFKLLLECKNTMSLDKMIDCLLENLALIIKEISLNNNESNLAVPFLVALMYKAILFRPSAVHNLALKDLFLFTCDLIKKYQHVLKSPLHESPFELNVQPTIFQYELIDSLIILYAFDLLELTFRILQLRSNDGIQEFLDEDSMKNIESIYKLALPISFLPISNVIINMIEILKLLSTMCLNIKVTGSTEVLPSKWWRECITRLYDIFKKDINNQNDSSSDNRTLYLDKKFNCFGLIRNVGNNDIAKFIPKLVDIDKLRSIPKVISKDDISEIPSDFTLNSELEKLFLQLKDEMLNIFDDLLIVYDNSTDVINTELLIQLTKLISKEQNFMISRYIVQISMNLDIRCNLIEHYLTLMYKIWAYHQEKINFLQIKDNVESELVTALWRIIVSQVEDKRGTLDIESSSVLNNPNKIDVFNHRELVDQFAELELNNDILLYEDAFEDMPNYIKEEILRDAVNKSPRIMQIKYDVIYQEMAKNILETKLDISTSMEDIDSVYLTMGN